MEGFYDWQGRQVAVTGATGFVGQQLVRLLVRASVRVHAIVRPSSNIQWLRELGVECRVASLDSVDGLTRVLQGAQSVVHLAAAVDFHGDWDRFRQINVRGTENLLQAARLAGVRRVAHVSSIVSVGASHDGTVLTESSPWTLGPLQVPYITTKREAEQAALAANGDGLEVVVLNPGSVIGPEDHGLSEFGTMCKRYWKGRIRVYFGGGTNFVDVRDVAAGIVAGLERGRAGERYLLTGENLEFREFFARLSKAAGRGFARLRLPNLIAPPLAALLKNNPGKRPMLSPEQARLVGWKFYFDAGKAQKELGFKARPVDQSLEDAYEFWFGKKAA